MVEGIRRALKSFIEKNDTAQHRGIETGTLSVAQNIHPDSWSFEVQTNTRKYCLFIAKAATITIRNLFIFLSFKCFINFPPLLRSSDFCSEGEKTEQILIINDRK